MSEQKTVAVIGVGAVLPDAPDAPTFWQNILAGKVSIQEVPPGRWRPDLYYDPDPAAPDKTYSKIGGWVQGFTFQPLRWGIAIPPRLLETMDITQQWAIAACRQALMDYGYPERPLNPERVAVILGNAMGGENNYRSCLRIHLPDYMDALSSQPAFQNLPAALQAELLRGMQSQIQAQLPPITEDTMPGELSNIIAGRVANIFNFHGPNFITDAACASSLAALQASIDGLLSHQFDAALTGGVDRNMGVETFVKFCKVGALSPDGSRPYAEGANGFVMGEGAAVFLLKRLEDAERDQDRIYAVIRGLGSSSDGKGKGITAPNPAGQQRAIERAWKAAGVPPESARLVEGHGTSTRVGDVAEVNSLDRVFSPLGVSPETIALGSVKSNIGHLKSAAGAAGLLKAIFALSERTLPPSASFVQPNPQIGFGRIPFYVSTQPQPWEQAPGEVRRAGVSAFGFGGTNFHAVLEEYVPGLLTGAQKSYPTYEVNHPDPDPVLAQAGSLQPYRGMLYLGARTREELRNRLAESLKQVKRGGLPPAALPAPADLEQPERLVIDYADAAELVKRAEKALSAFDSPQTNLWPALTTQGIYRGSGAPGKVAFLFPGQGSQYLNMLRDLAEVEPVVADTFREADRVMAPILGRPLTDYIFIDGGEEAFAAAEAGLRSTEITQPAILTANVALLRVLEKFGIQPDLVIGHSLGEYAALVAAGALTFAAALEIVSARGREMTRVSLADNGCMAAVSAPIEAVERILQTLEGYIVIANVNSPLQSVIAGETAAVEAALPVIQAAGFQAVKIPVSHAFHTKIVAPASEPMRRVIDRMEIRTPEIPVIANVTGGLYPTQRDQLVDLLAQQVASPVQFVAGVQTLYALGARVFVEVGPKRVLNSLAADILKVHEGVTILATNHHRKGGLASFNEALCGLYAAGVRAGKHSTEASPEAAAEPAGPAHIESPATAGQWQPLTGSVVISGAGLGLPGRNTHTFADENIQAILRGESRIEPLPLDARRQMIEKRVTRLEKSPTGAVMVEIEDLDSTIKLAGQTGTFDPVEEFGIPEERVDTWDISTQLAVAAGIEALRDAGIPLMVRYRQTSTGSYLPTRRMLPEALADETGVIFASAFPGLDRMTEEAERFYEHKNLASQIEELEQILALVPARQKDLHRSLQQRITQLNARLEALDYHFDRRFIFRTLTMGHSQFSEYIGARGPSTSVNAACATTTHAVALAEDWIRAGRCRRVVVIAGDDVTGSRLVSWIGAGLLASGATTTEGDLRLAALPFDRRRNGMIMGMGAAGLVVESADAARERGVRGICEILASQVANSAFHGTRLDVDHVSQVMDRLVRQAEQRFGIRRAEIAAQTFFMSHETYTPARGGSAAAEINALRRSFGEAASQVVIANTKGFTGHTMGVGVEDVVAVKALEYGQVPPVANFNQDFEPDGDLGSLNLSQGGAFPARYALRLGAGFGSQVAMTLYRKIPGVGERLNPQVYQPWLAAVSGNPDAEVEIVQRTLQVRSNGLPVRAPAPSTWQFGQGPSAWAVAPGEGAPAEAASPQPAAAGSEAGHPEPAPQAAVNPEPHPAAPQPGFDEVRERLLEMVSDKTGYPAEILDLDLDLEGDLGIDTVKQAELFASIREQYGIPRREDLRLSNYNTLAKVVQYVLDETGQSEAAEAPARPVVSAVEPVPAGEAEPTGQALSDGETQTSETHEAIAEFIRSLVSEKTGYPAEILEPDLDLEGDLGVDTVKQAELFATVRAHYGFPRRDDLRLSDYNTLAKIAGYVTGELESLQAAESASIAGQQDAPKTGPDSTAAAAPPADQPRMERKVRRRAPAPVLRPRLDLCQPTGVELGPQSRVLIVPDRSAAGEALAQELRSRGVQVLTLASTPIDALNSSISAWLAEGPVQGLYFLPALDVESEAAEMSPQDWHSALEERLFSLAATLRLLPDLSFLVCATRLGGVHGYSPEGASAPLGGAVSGLAKAAARERPGLLVKVVDFAVARPDAAIAPLLVEETLRDPGIVEAGWEDDQRFGISLVEEETGSGPGLSLNQESVFLITGGSGGITTRVALDLARRTQGKFYLAGRASLPPADDPQLARIKTSRAGLQQDLIRQMAAEGLRAAPVEAERRLAALERAAGVYEAMAEITRMGGQAHYLPCDVTRPEDVARLVQTVWQAEGRLDVVIHAAGIEHSRRLESKSDAEFRQVVAAKADGFFNLYQALLSQRLPDALVIFSSVAGRFGNAGQTDYSAANDLLCKLAAALRRRHPEMNTVALNWGPWTEVGMASRGHIPELLEQAGIEMIHPDEAAPLVYQELVSGSARSEIVLAGGLGDLEAGGRADGGLDLALANQALTAGSPAHVMFSRVTGLDLYQGVVFEAELDPEKEPFLKDHTLDGTPLLPGVMGIEGFCAAAQHVSSVLASSHHGFQVARLEDIRFQAPFKFYKNQPRRVIWKAQVLRQAEGLVAGVTLESRSVRPHQPEEVVQHFSGRVYLEPSQEAVKPMTVPPPQWNGARTVERQDIYQLYFHGPAFQVLDGVQRSGRQILGRLNKNLPPVTTQQNSLVSMPILLELCLQTAGVWEVGATGTMVLPRSIGNLKLYPARANGEPVFAEVLPTRDDQGQVSFRARVVDGKGNLYLELNDYQTSAFPYPVEPRLLSPLKDVL